MGKAVPSSGGGAKAFNGTKKPPSGAATRKIPIYPETTGDSEARRLLSADMGTNRVAPPKNANTPSSSASARQVSGRKHSGGARITGGTP